MKEETKNTSKANLALSFITMGNTAFLFLILIINFALTLTLTVTLYLLFRRFSNVEREVTSSPPDSGPTKILKILESFKAEIQHQFDDMSKRLSNLRKQENNLHFETLDGIAHDLNKIKQENERFSSEIGELIGRNKGIEISMKAMQQMFEAGLKQRIGEREETRIGRERINKLEQNKTRQIPNTQAQGADPATNEADPKERLRSALLKYKDERHISDVLQNLDLQEEPKTSLRKIIELYRLYFGSKRHEVAEALENVLASEYGVQFNHVTVGYHRSAAIGFQIVKKEEIFKLEGYEKEKINFSASDQTEPDSILMELCPQVRVNNELVLKGKIIAS